MRKIGIFSGLTFICVQERICKKFAATGSCPYSPRCRFSHQLPSASPSPPPPPPTTTTHQTPSASTNQTQTTTTTTTTAATSATFVDWSPLDDDIDVRLSGSSPSEKPPSREEVNAYIDRFLYGGLGQSRRRLPVFEEICPSSDN